MTHPTDKNPQSAEIDQLKARLEEAEQTLEAIRTGHVDALIVYGSDGEKVFTLQGADHRYRRIVESMTEGAAIISAEGVVLYANVHFAEMTATPLERVIGSQLRKYLPRAALTTFERLVRDGQSRTASVESELINSQGQIVPVHVSAANDGETESGGICLIVTDLTQAMRESDARFSFLADSVPQLVWTAKTDGAVDYFNQRWFDYTGADWASARGWGWASLVYDEDQPSAIEAWRSALKTGEPFERQIRLRRAGDGELRWHLVRAEPLRDAKGAILRWFGTWTDIDDQRRVAEEQAAARKKIEVLAATLRVSEERFRTLATTASEIVWTTDAEGSIREDSPTWRVFTGQSMDEYLNGKAAEAIHPDDLKFMRGMWRNGIADGAPFAGDVRMRRFDGVYRTMEVRAAPVLNEDGTLREWVGANTDVTERRVAEDKREFLADASNALASSLDYHVTLARVARLAVPKLADWCTVDVVEEGQPLWKQLAVAHIDPAKVDLAGEIGRRYPPNANAKQGLPEVLRTGKPEVYPQISDAMLVGSAVDEDHLRIMRDLKLRSAMIVPIAAREKTLGAITFIFAESGRQYEESDLSFAQELAARAGIAIDNARLYASEHAARELADASNRAKDEFLATVSHELRTPLNAMLGWARMLSGGTLPPEKQVRAIEAIERNALAQAQLIEDLLDVSRIVSGKLRLEVESVDLSKVVRAAVDTVGPAIEAKGIRFNMIVDPQAAEMNGDPNRLQQVVWNLLSNAVKFTPRGGKVEMVLKRVDSHFELWITDAGRGIPGHFLPYVFDRFRQADGGITRAHGGLGLGLAISRHLVELHGGTIDAMSEGENRGATFVVRLPRAAVRSTPVDARRAPFTHASEPTFTCPPEIRALKVLVVDDEEDARELLVAILERCGAVVTTAASSEQAIEAIDRDPPSVLLSDIGMPGEDGYSLIGRIRQRPPEKGGGIPAAALTSFARAEDRRKALQAGYQMHVPKPAEPAELVAVVANLARMTIGPR